jgi:hypothetical protein
VHDDVAREHRDQVIHVAAARGVGEALEELEMLAPRGPEARTRQADVLLRASEKLPRVRFGHGEHLRDLRVLVGGERGQT